MIVFRSLALGLLGACFLLLVTKRYEVVRARAPAPRPAYVVSVPAATIVDVASGVPASQLAALVHLAPYEHVIAVDDHPVVGDLDAGSMIASRETRWRTYFDLTVATPAGNRRVLVLLH